MYDSVFRLLVTGSRGWEDFKLLNAELDNVRAGAEGAGQELLVVHGACPTGADALAAEWAACWGVHQESHPADWGQHGRAAGPIRNAEMVALGASLCLAFLMPCTRHTVRCPAGPHDSRGASHCADLAEARHINVRRIRPVGSYA